MVPLIAISLAEPRLKFAKRSIVVLSVFLDCSTPLQHYSTCWTRVSIGHLAIATTLKWLPSNHLFLMISISTLAGIKFFSKKFVV